MIGVLVAACSPERSAAAGVEAVGTDIRAAAAAPSQAQHGLQEVPLIIHSANGDHRFDVELADTPERQEAGLMFRTSLAADRGMIFPYDPPRQVAFWMKNTLIPLDIVYIDAGGRIASIAANATPMSLDPIDSRVPVSAVLELRGGRAAELGIREGDRVSWGS